MDRIDDRPGVSTSPQHSLLGIDLPGAAVDRGAGAQAHLQLMGELQSSHAVLLHWMCRELGDRERAADLLNQAVQIALDQQRRGQLRCGDDIAGHVFKIGMQLLRKQQRERDHRPRLDRAGGAAPMDPLEPSAESGHNDGRDEQLRQTVRTLLESLSLRERQLVAQFYLDSVDKQSLCRQFSVSSPQFNGIVARIRQRMKAMLDPGHLR